jgi:transcription elongation factor Elf1
MIKHFKEFFVCPHCGRERVSKEELPQYKGKFCGCCGKNITNALAEALAEMMEIDHNSGA